MRLEVTRKADLAVRAMRLLGGTPSRMKAPELAEALGTTAGFVAQVMNPLVKEQWVRSDPGPTGGYSLAVDLDAVSVLEVIEAIDGPTDQGRCVVEARTCNAASPCMLHDAWSQARAELMRMLGDMPLDRLDTRVQVRR